MKKPKTDAERLRSFGLILGVLLAFFSWRWGRKGWTIAPYALGAGALSIAAALARPLLLEPVERRWMKVAKVLAKINTHVILGAMYYLLFTPFGFVLRLVGNEPLEEKPDGSSTYWKKTKTGGNPRSYERQF